MGFQGFGTDQFNTPEGIDVAKDGKIFVADTGNSRVSVWDPDGKPVTTYGSFGTLGTWRNVPQFNHPGGIFVHPSGKIYVADTLNHRVVILDEKGLVVSTWGSQGKDNGEFNEPRDICKDHLGNIWVLDSGNSRVQVFSGLGVFSYTWGSFGTDPGFMNQPLGIALNQIDQAILANTGNFRMEVFNDPIAPVPTPGILAPLSYQSVPVTFEGWFGDGPDQFKDPGGVAITHTGVIAVTDGGTGRVEFFNNRFDFLGQWSAKDDILSPGYNPRFRGIACDRENRLYLADAQNSVIVRLKLVEKAGDDSNPSPAPTAAPPPPAPTAVPAEVDPYGGAGYPIR